MKWRQFNRFLSKKRKEKKEEKKKEYLPFKEGSVTESSSTALEDKRGSQRIVLPLCSMIFPMQRGEEYGKEKVKHKQVRF